MGNGVSVEQAYAMEMEEVQKVRAEEAVAAAKDVSEEKLAALMADAAAVAAGQAKFQAVCVACHGKQGEGLIGPNLTDAAWLHGDGSLMAIRDVVVNGVVEKGMIPWGPTMAPDELNRVVAYLGTLRGTNVPGKEPQGVDPKAQPAP
jgi:cytochrome c oxidase cbb3-type subunit 3